MHGLVVGGVLFGIICILNPTDVGIGTIDAEVNGNAARLVVQIDLHDATLFTNGVAKADLIGSGGHRREFEGDIEHTGYTHSVGAIGVPVAHVGVNAHVGLGAYLPVGDVLVLESSQDVLAIAATTVTVHEVGAEHGSIDADAAIEYLVAYFGSVGKDVIEIVVHAVEGVLVDASRL